MAKRKIEQPKKFFNPFLLSLAAATSWAALHEPGHFDDLSMIGAWLISALSIGFLARAGLAMMPPLFKLLADILRYFIYQNSTDDKSDA